MKLNTCTAVLLAVAIGAAMAVSAAAAPFTVFVDFGDSAQPTPAAENYNHIFVNDTTGPLPDLTNPFDDVLSIADLIDDTGANTGIGLTAEGFFKGSNTAGTQAPTGDAAMFHAQATRDNAFGHALAFGANPLTPQALVTLTGLNPLNTYDFTFMASRVGVGGTPPDIRETEYAVSGSNSGTAFLDATNNTSNVTTVLGIMPNAMGEITVLLDPGPNNNNASRFYYLGAMRLECIPEPASGLLLLLGVVGAAAWARRRRS